MVGEGSVKVPQTLADGWAVQRRVIHALLMREVLTRFGRHNIGFLWMFVEPMVFTLFVAAFWTLSGLVHISNIPIVAFAITGYTNVLLWRNPTNRLVNSVEPNAALMYHRYVRYLDVLLARGLLEITGVVVAFSTLCVMFWVFDVANMPEDPLKVVAGLALLAWFGFSLGILVGAVAERGELVEKIWHPLSYIMFPMSGAAYLVDALPTSAQSLALLLPMVHGVELLREGYFGSSFTAHYSVSYLVGANLLITFLGLAQVRVVAARIHTG
jgi:ABC-2 type transport system permease protein/capsular polysaccharide transport system permease protein